jgi:hypothetical protein
VFHLNARDDAALKAAAGPNALIANDTVPQAQAASYYTTIPPLSQTIAQLAPAGVALSPVVVCGFSAGGWATRTILQKGGDPDALVVADGTYGTAPSDWAAWQAYANRAMAGQRIFFASYTSLLVASSTWHVLCAITGQTLPLGPVAGRPAGAPLIAPGGMAGWQKGKFTVLGYPTNDAAGHEQQGDTVLPSMLRQAMGALRGAPAATPPSGLGEGLLIAAGVVAVLGAGLAVALPSRARASRGRPPRRRPPRPRA